MLSYCVCPNFNQGPLLKRLTWIFCNFTKTVKKKWNHAPSKGLMWKSRFYILLLPFLLNIVFLFILIYFFARISLNKYVYFMLQSAIAFMDILCIQYCSCWELKLLIKIIPSSEMSISQMCCYISVTFIYKLSVHNLFFIYSFIV